MKKALPFLYYVLSVFPLSATAVTWTGSASNDMSSASNWSPGLPAATDQAVFQASSATSTSPTLSSGSLQIYELLLNEESSAFSFSIDSGAFSFGTPGESGSSTTSGVNTTSAPDDTQLFSITNSGSITFYGESTASATSDLNVKYTAGVASSATLTFTDTATAGHSTLEVGTNSGTAELLFDSNSSAGAAELFIGDHTSTSGLTGTLIFKDNAKAGYATVHVGDSVDGLSSVTFEDNSSLENGFLEVLGSNILSSSHGSAEFLNNSSAGGIDADRRSVIIIGNVTGFTESSAQLDFRDDSTANFSNIFVGDHLGESHVDFYDNSTAANSLIYSGSFSVYSKPVTGTVSFHDNTTAGDAEIHVGDSYGESAVYFDDNSTAANATIIIGATDEGHPGNLTFNRARTGSPTAGNATIEAYAESFVHFYEGSSTGTCSIKLTEGSTLAIDGSATHTLRSLSGDNTTTIHLASSTLEIDYSGTEPITLASVIYNEDGSIVKKGTGKLIFSGIGVYTGGTTLEEGTLEFTGSLQSDLTVTGGTLVATGSITGSYTQEDSTFEAGLGGISSSPLSATGTASLTNSPLVVTLKPRFSPDYKYTLLTADGGLTGEFSSITFDPATYGINTDLASYEVSYDANNAFFMIQTRFGDQDDGTNATSVGTSLDNDEVISTAQASLLRSLVQESSAAASSSLHELSGEQYTNFLYTAEQLKKHYLRNTYEPIRHLISTKEEFSSCRRDEAVWSFASGGHSLLKEKNTVTGVGINRVEYALGGHKTFGSTWTLGASSSFAYHKLSYGLDAYGRSRNILGGLYTIYRPSKFYVLLNGMGGFSQTNFRRFIHIGDTTWKQKSKPRLSQMAVYGETGMDFHTRSSLIQPFFGLQGGHIHQSKVKEHSNDAANLTLFKKVQNVVDSRLGIHITGASDECILFGLDLAWNYRLTKNSSALNAKFSDFGNNYSLKGIYLTRGRFEGALFATAPVTPNWRIFSKLSGELASGENSYGLLGGVEASW